jgi:hypothetical protein
VEGVAVDLAPALEGIASLKGIAANLEALKKEAKTTGSSEGDFADKVRSGQRFLVTHLSNGCRCGCSKVLVLTTFISL